MLEPYPDELLYSWFIRMAKWYGVSDLSQRSIKVLKDELLWPYKKINLYVPEYLDYLVEAINMPNSQYFGSYNRIIDKMSVFPFYSCFVSDEIRNTINAIFRKSNSNRDIENSFNIRKSFYKYYEENLGVKVCKYCMREKGEFYLLREHQIQDNYVCYKHKKILKFIPFNKMNECNLFKLGNEDMTNCIQKNSKFFDIRVEAANVIHALFKHNELGSLQVIKSKIRKKLRELNYIHNDSDLFIDENKFWDDFSHYNICYINTFELVHILYFVKNDISPIAYISIILFLFGSINEFVDYDINAEEIESKYINYPYQTSMLIEPKNKKKSIDDYNNKLQSINKDEFVVVQILSEDKRLIIKHKICGKTWSVDKGNIWKLKHCPHCKNKNK